MICISRRVRDYSGMPLEAWPFVADSFLHCKEHPSCAASGPCTMSQLVLMIRMLRPLQIDPRVLKARLDSGEKFGVVDLLRFEEDPEGVAAIPGAVRLDPLELRRKKRIVVPDDVNLVIYCRRRNSFVSARVAVAMRKHGIHNVHVLAGGLEAWKSLGFSA